MKRRVAFMLLLLVGGAIVNVAVAWGLSQRAWQSGSGQEWLADEASVAWWRMNAPPGFPASPATMYEAQRFGYWSVMLYETEGMDSSTRFLGWRTAEGWPLVCMEWSSWMDRKLRAYQRRNVFEWNGWPSAPGTSRKIPLRPIWHAFALNSLFYAAILWLFSFAWFVLRRRKRIRRGLCPKCAYPVGESHVCTECGAALPSPSR